MERNVLFFCSLSVPRTDIAGESKHVLQSPEFDVRIIADIRKGENHGI